MKCRLYDRCACRRSQVHRLCVSVIS